MDFFAGPLLAAGQLQNVSEQLHAFARMMLPQTSSASIISPITIIIND
jgi:hypothetical protein